MASHWMFSLNFLPGANIPDMQMQTENRYFFFEDRASGNELLILQQITINPATNNDNPATNN